MAASPTTVRLNTAAAILKLEAVLRDIGVGRRTPRDRTAIAALQQARTNLLNETDN